MENLEQRLRYAYDILHKQIEYGDFDLHALNNIFDSFEIGNCQYFNNFCHIVVKSTNSIYILWKELHNIILYNYSTKEKYSFFEFITKFEKFDEDKLLKLEILALKQL